MSVDAGLSPYCTSNEALIPELCVLLSPEPSTELTARRPGAVFTAMSPGVTVAPLASIVRTPDGTATFAPAAAMRPARTRTVPFWTSPTGPGVRRCALVIAKVCAATGEAVAARARAMPVKTGSRRCISFLPDRLADFKIASVARGGIARVEDERAVDEDLLGDGVDAERILAPQDRKSTSLNSNHYCDSPMPSSA